MRQTPIDDLMQAVANVYAEREILLKLIRDQAQLLEFRDTGSLQDDAEYREMHQSVRTRTAQVLGE